MVEREGGRKCLWKELRYILTLLLSVLNLVFTYATQILLFCFFISSLEMVPGIEAI